jgi:hypothetical protein
MDQREFERRATLAAREHAAWVRRNLAQTLAELDAAVGPDGSRVVGRAGRLGRGSSGQHADEPVPAPGAERTGASTDDVLTGDPAG